MQRVSTPAAARPPSLRGGCARREGLDRAADELGQPHRRADQLGAHLGPARFEQDGQHPLAGGAHGANSLGRGGAPCRDRERPALGQRPDGHLDLLAHRTVEHPQHAVVLHRVGGADHGRASGLAPGARAQLGGTDAGDPIGGHRSPTLGVHLARVAQPFGHRQDGGQLHLDVRHAVVQLELAAEPLTAVFESLDPAGEGQAEELGQFRPDLAGLAIERVATHEHEVVGAAAFERGGEGPGRGQRVGAGEGLVADVEPSVGAPGHRLAQHVLGAGRTERQRRAGPTRLAGQRDPVGHGPAAVGVHLEVETVTHQAAVLETHRLGQGDLLGQRGNTQRAAHRPGHPVHAPGAPVRVSTRSSTGSSMAGV